jgi:pimeloyl-ACP methyl ester carboxylesterase
MKKLLLILICLFSIAAYGNAANYFYDSHQVRYELYQTNGRKNYNWLFLPGGPGLDSGYLRDLIDRLELPGNVWLIDLPGNGGNLPDAFAENYDHWMEFFPALFERFANPILVGHSFGGMFPLLFPELEKHLKGFVILNSAPGLWMEEAVKYSKQFNLPDLSEGMAEFTSHPTQETFLAAVDACMPYYFPKETLEQGRKVFFQHVSRWQPAVWWQQKAVELNFSAKWIPQSVPTLILGAKYDCICPFSLFKKDKRFSRQNIRFAFIENAGHVPWIENPAAVRKAFDAFCSRLNTH